MTADTAEEVELEKYLKYSVLHSFIFLQIIDHQYVGLITAVKQYLVSMANLSVIHWYPSRKNCNHQIQRINLQKDSMPEIRLPALCGLSASAELLCLYLLHASLCACWLPWCTLLSQCFHLKGACVFPQKSHSHRVPTEKDTGLFFTLLLWFLSVLVQGQVFFAKKWKWCCYHSYLITFTFAHVKVWIK